MKLRSRLESSHVGTPFQPVKEQNDHVVYSFTLCVRGWGRGKSLQRYIRVLLSTHLANQILADLFIHVVLL